MDRKKIVEKFYVDVDRIVLKLRSVVEGELPEEAAVASLRLAAWCAAISVTQNGVPPDAAQELATYYLQRVDEMIRLMVHEDAKGSAIN